MGPITKLSVVEKMLKEVAHKHNLDSLKKNEATGLEYLEILDRLGYLLVVRPSKHTEEDFSSPSSPKARPRFSSFSSSSAVDSSFIPRKDRSHSFSAFSLSGNFFFFFLFSFVSTNSQKKQSNNQKLSRSRRKRRNR